MNCREFEMHLYTYLDGEFDAGARAPVEAHLAECPACAKLMHHERAFVAAFRASAKLLAPAAPEGLRARVQDEISSHTRKRLVMGSAVAASVAALTFTGVSLWQKEQSHAFAVDAVARHARQYPLEVHNVPPKQVEAWFGGKLDHRVEVPQFPRAIASGGRILNVRERPAAYIRYEAPRPNRPTPGQLGLFVFDDSRGDVSAGAEAEVEHSQGYNVVRWRNGDVVYQLVTDLDDDDARAMVREAQTPSGQPLRTPSEATVRPAGFNR